MAWSGGTFTGLHNWVTDQAAGIRILASRHKAQDDVFIAGINQAVNKDGSNALTGNLNAGSQKLTSVSAATLATDAPIASQVQDGSMTYAVDSGGANAYVIALAPVESAHVGGQVIWFKASAANTGASTLNVNGIGVKDIKKNHGQTLIADDIVANQLIGVVYDATTGDFEMVTMPAMIVANLTGNVTGNASGTALTVTQAAQTAITSVGTLTGLALSGTFTQDKGADVASTAGVMTLGADGNYFDISGTNSITGIATLGIGTFVTLHFDSAATLVHHSTDLIMPGAANVVCAAGDEFTFVEFASADWRCVSYALASGSAIVTGAGVKGADVASTAGVMTLGDGTYFDITGTNSITGIATLGIGTEVSLHFDAAAVLVHDATDFVLPGGANITCAANDEFTFVEYASADWRCVSYALASGLAIGGGNSTTDGLYEHSFTIAGAYTIGTGNNALSAGPITIGSSGSVTVPATSTWVIA